MPNQSNLRLSVIPEFNEELRLPATLRAAVEYLAAQPYRSEILAVNDDSTDRTGQIVNRWPSRTVPVHLLHHPDRANHDKGAALQRGMLAAQGDFQFQ